MAKLAGKEKSAYSNPPLPPSTVVLQLTPSDDLRGFGKHSFNFYRYNRVGGQVRLDHPADQKVLLFGQGLYSRPFGQQQFFSLSKG